VILIDQKTFAELRTMVGEDFIHELLETYFESSPQLIAEMQAALVVRDAATFQRAAHSMKSNSASFGALELAAQARNLETQARQGNLDGAALLLSELKTTYDQVEHELKELAG
jgi:HPt (histidine-containing phosphotransfer) domain-containing protein